MFGPSIYFGRPKLMLEKIIQSAGSGRTIGLIRLPPVESSGAGGSDSWSLSKVA